MSITRSSDGQSYFDNQGGRHLSDESAARANASYSAAVAKNVEQTAKNSKHQLEAAREASRVAMFQTMLMAEHNENMEKLEKLRILEQAEHNQKILELQKIQADAQQHQTDLVFLSNADAEDKIRFYLGKVIQNKSQLNLFAEQEFRQCEELIMPTAENLDNILSAESNIFDLREEIRIIETQIKEVNERINDLKVFDEPAPSILGIVILQIVVFSITSTIFGIIGTTDERQPMDYLFICAGVVSLFALPSLLKRRKAWKPSIESGRDKFREANHEKKTLEARIRELEREATNVIDEFRGVLLPNLTKIVDQSIEKVTNEVVSNKMSIIANTGDIGFDGFILSKVPGKYPKPCRFSWNELTNSQRDLCKFELESLIREAIEGRIAEFRAVILNRVTKTFFIMAGDRLPSMSEKTSG